MGPYQKKGLIFAHQMKLPILFEDESLLAIDKPPGTLSIPDRYDRNKPNLFSMLEEQRGKGNVFTVHRLDKDTSGVLIFAKTASAHQNLSLQFEHRIADKWYLAVVDGILREEQGSIDLPIAHDPNKDGRMIIHPKGKPSLTLWTLQKAFSHFSVLSLNLKTGRTHQARIHCMAIQHPLVVDPMYGRREALLLSEIKGRRYNGDLETERPLMSRTPLHAARVTIQHPLSDQALTLEAPLPKDMSALIRQLERWDS